MRCGNDVQDLVVCVSVGDYGHPICLPIEYFKDYPFYGRSECFDRNVVFYGQMDSTTRAQWTRSLPENMRFWKRAARNSLESLDSTDSVSQAPAERTDGRERNSLGVPFTPQLGWTCIFQGLRNREPIQRSVISQETTPSTAEDIQAG